MRRETFHFCSNFLTRKWEWVLKNIFQFFCAFLKAHASATRRNRHLMKKKFSLIWHHVKSMSQHLRQTISVNSSREDVRKYVLKRSFVWCQKKFKNEVKKKCFVISNWFDYYNYCNCFKYLICRRKLLFLLKPNFVVRLNLYNFKTTVITVTWKSIL